VETHRLHSHSEYAVVISGFALLASRVYQVVEGATISLALPCHAINVLLVTVKSLPQLGCVKFY
jgi:hypothetical protein